MLLMWTGNEFQAAGPATVNELSANRVGDADNARPENAAPDCRDGKCRTGKCRKRHCMERRTLLMST